MKVSFFATCLVDQLYPQVGLASVNLLKKLGVEVKYDESQTCCGQPAYNTGYIEETQKIARQFIKVFRDREYIISPSGSCAAMIKCHYPELFGEGSPEYRDVKEMAGRVYEFSDFLVSVLKVSDVGARFPHRVTFHDSCHQFRQLGIYDQPRKLIKNVKDIEFVELEDSTRCCGFGGTFSVKFSDVSAAMVKEKVNRITESNAEYVIATDVSCMMNISGCISRNNNPVKAMHLAQLLMQ
ncbi:MAG: (Fe-S)-binding protein [Acidobacteriota bacterium]